MREFSNFLQYTHKEKTEKEEKDKEKKEKKEQKEEEKEQRYREESNGFLQWMARQNDKTPSHELYTIHEAATNSAKSNSSNNDMLRVG